MDKHLIWWLSLAIAIAPLSACYDPAEPEVDPVSMAQQAVARGPAVPSAPTLVADIYPGAGGSEPIRLTSMNGNLYFAAHTSTGYEPWITNGDKKGTFLLKDIIPGVIDSDPNWFTPTGNLMYFTAGNPRYQERGLWRTDGTPDGTIALSSDSLISSPFLQLTAVGSTVYFFNSARWLWKNDDGTDTGTHAVKVLPETQYFPADYAAAVGKFFFRYSDATYGSELWVSDGTEAGTHIVLDLNSGPADSTPLTPIAFGNYLYFTADDGIAGRELWRTDGTFFGTELVSDIYPGSTGSRPSIVAAGGGRLWLTADDGIKGHGLWVSDGTSAGTGFVKDLNPLGDDFIDRRTAFLGSTFLFVLGDKLWKSDGTAAGTTILKAADVQQGSLTAVGSLAFFRVGISQLWMTDGTPGRTMLLKDFGNDSTGLWYLTGAGDTLFFVTADAKTGSELWKVTLH